MRTKGFWLSLILLAAAPLPAAVMVDFVLDPNFAPSKQPQGVALGSDGNLWITAFAANSILRVSAGGVVLGEYPLPTAGAQPLGIAAGPDGALWFTEYNASKIGRITTDGVVTEFPILSGAGQPYFICHGPDGALWFTELGVSRIGRITTSGVVTEFTRPEGRPGSAPGRTARSGSRNTTRAGSGG